jgi:hypothetical protein
VNDYVPARTGFLQDEIGQLKRLVRRRRVQIRDRFVNYPHPMILGGLEQARNAQLGHFAVFKEANQQVRTVSFAQPREVHLQVAAPVPTVERRSLLPGR